jgi:hypothetical protein
MIYHLIIENLKQKKKIFHIEKFEQYMILLEFNMKKAYEIIHKDRIMIYSLEATTPSEFDFEAAMKDFIYLTLKFLGPALKQELIDFFGSEDTLMFNIAEYFNTCYENDEVRKNMTNKLMGEDEENSQEEYNLDMLK